VFRWEWAPGSTLFLVWQLDRGDVRDAGRSLSLDGLPGAFATPGRSTLAVKITRWMSL